MAERDRLMNAIGDRLGLPRVPKGVGSSVHNDFIGPLTVAVGLDPDDYRDKYRRIQAVLERLGQTYDPTSDTSEATPSGGGGTLTNGGLRKILRGLDDLPVRDLSTAEEEVEVGGDLDPEDVEDARERQLRAIAVRRGQRAFRASLLVAYGGRCAVTGDDAGQALEAAHVVPYRGPLTNTVNNGLLLRADIHILFDLGCLGIDPDRGHRVVLDQATSQTTYGRLLGTEPFLPDDESDRPDPALLRWHIHRWKLFG